MTYNHLYDGKVRLFATERTEFCLGASPHKKLTSKEFKRGSFSPCRREANQVYLYEVSYLFLIHNLDVAKFNS